MDKVDVHVHILAKLSDEFPREVSSMAPADREGTAEQLLEEMDATGIDKAVLIEMGGTKLEHHNYVTHCVRRWPDRFTSTGLVDINDPDPPARLRELMDATPIEGIRLGTLGDPGAEKAEDLITYGLFTCADELGLNINLYGGPGNVGYLELLAPAFPDVNISIDHLGVTPTTAFTPDPYNRPRFDHEPLPPANYPEILRLARFDNIFVKISGEYAFSKVPWPYGDMKSMVEQIHQAYGAERMQWCTDFPWIVPDPTYAKLVELPEHHLSDIPAGDRAMIMGGSALKIWFRR